LIAPSVVMFINTEPSLPPPPSTQPYDIFSPQPIVYPLEFATYHNDRMGQKMGSLATKSAGTLNLQFILSCINKNKTN